MTLYSLDDEFQNCIGQREHWNQFQRFEGSTLHSAIVAELRSFLHEGAVYSRRVGAQVLAKIEAQSPDLLETYHEDELGGLLGMTLWNLVAKDAAEWRFWREPGSTEETGGYVYFQRS